MYKIAIITHRETNCGVHNFAKTVYEILSKSSNYSYEFVTMDNINEFALWYSQTNADAILWNYHHDTVRWLTESVSREITLPQFMITGHDICAYYPNVLAHFVCDPTLKDSEYFISIPRPIIYDHDIVYAPPGHELKIGSFGFGQYSKNFPGIVRMVNEQFIEPVTVNLHISYGAFVDASGALAHEIADQCRAIANSNVKLNITHAFKTTQEIVEFLNSNDINIFNYDSQPGRGVSSCIDYALAARKPFAVSDSDMYRHVTHNEKILLSKNRIKDIVKNNIIPLSEFYNQWSVENFIAKFENKFRNHLLNDLALANGVVCNKENFRFKFNNLKKITASYAQLGQDLFAVAVSNGKINGTYVEIGSGDPIKLSNTYLLENNFFWKGVSLDIDLNSVLLFSKSRKNRIELSDARIVDVKRALVNAGIEQNQIDYLSIDCGDADTTYKALINTPFDLLKFAAISYGYSLDHPMLEAARAHLRNKNYVLIVSKVSNTDATQFDDWWLHPELVPQSIIDATTIVDDSTIKYFEQYLFSH